MVIQDLPARIGQTADNRVVLRVVLIEQYRHGFRDVTLEIPGGCPDAVIMQGHNTHFRWGNALFSPYGGHSASIVCIMSAVFGIHKEEAGDPCR